MFSNGHGGGPNYVWGVLLLAVIALVILFRICKPESLSYRGQTYLSRLSVAFGPVPGSGRGDDANLLLVVALFGLVALAETEYGHLPEIFRIGRMGGSWGGGDCGSCGSCSSCGGG